MKRIQHSRERAAHHFGAICPSFFRTRVPFFYFCRPGPRLVDSLEILAHTLHPEVHPLPDGLPRPVAVDGSSVGIFDGVSSATA